MKIAMLGQKGIPAQSGGIEQHVDILSQHLVARGHEVVVYCRRSYCGRSGRSTSENGLHRIFRPSVPTKHLDALTHTFAGTLDVILRRADVVHYHALGPAALAPLARLSRLPVVVTVHGLDWQRAKWGPFAKRCIKFGEWIAASTAHTLIVVSPVLRDYFAQHYGIASTFIPNGVIPLSYRQPDEMVQWGLEPRRFLLSVSRLVPEKGLHYLIRAFSQTKTDAKLVIAGGGGFDTDYEKHLHALADDRVVFTGPVDRGLLAELYSHAKLFVLPSDLEGMSIALLEAMNMGVPALVSDIPENACVVEDAGFTFRAGDRDHLRDVLEDVLGDPGQLADFGSRASKQVAPFQWPSVVDQLEQVYSSCGGIQLDPSGTDTVTAAPIATGVGSDVTPAAL